MRAAAARVGGGRGAIIPIQLNLTPIWCTQLLALNLEFTFGVPAVVGRGAPLCSWDFLAADGNQHGGT